MSEHLVDAETVRRFDVEARAGFEWAVAAEAAGKNRKTYLEGPAKAIHAIDRRRELLELVEGYRRLKRDLGLMDFGDQIAWAARLVQRAARGGGGRARPVQGGAPRRVPGHLRGAGHDAVPALLRAHAADRAGSPGDGGRRPQPGDLRLARRLGLQHPQLRRDLPRRRRSADAAPAHHQPALGLRDPRGGQPAGRPAPGAVRRQGGQAPRQRRPPGRAGSRPTSSNAPSTSCRG